MSPVPPRPDRAARLLHTSDWHLGVTVRDQSRGVDHDAAIAELVGVAEVARPDLIVHTGDLFDGPRPAMSEFGRAIRALRALAEVAPVVVLAGNHDSAVALEVLGLAVGDGHADDVAAGRYDPFALCRHRVRVHPKPTVPESGAVSTYATAAGWELRLAALPFVHANRVLTDFAALTEPNATYNDSLRRIIGHLTRACLTGFDPTRQVAVFASHLHIAGARTSSEREIHISTGYATDAAHLDPAYGYLAFGHVHVPQVVAGGRGRYAGSLLEVDFGEEGETKQAGIIDLEPGRPTAVTSVPLTAARRLRRLRTYLTALAERADELRGELVEVTVAPEPGAGPVDRDAPIWTGGESYDTLSGAVRALLPEVAVVGVVDARNPVGLLADDLPPSDAVETIDDAFNAWLVEGGAALLSRSPRASVGRVAELFAELRAAVASGESEGPSPPEVAALEDVLDP